MILRMPSYYRDFSCIADRCTDNCCIGWEIDIDEKTAQYYSSVDGEFGERLKKSISDENPPFFITDKNDRCPFLNKNNLCDIILTLGENSLCQICTDHPRYYEWFGYVKECGIGLSCEEAARIILSYDSPFSFSETEIPLEESDCPDEKFFAFLCDARKAIISHLEDETVPFPERIYDVIAYSVKLSEISESEELSLPPIKRNKKPPVPDIKGIIGFLDTLEHINPEWAPALSALAAEYPDVGFFSKKSEKYLKNTAVYFVWRYFLKSVYDGNIIAKINLMATSVFVLGFIFSCIGKEGVGNYDEKCITAAKDYSKEIEYSEDNLDALADAAYMNKAFSYL